MPGGSSVTDMDLLDEESHRLLLWAVRLAEVDVVPQRSELRRLCEPRRPAGLAILAGLSGRNGDYHESAMNSLVRRGLLEERDDRVTPTELGRLTVSALGLHPEQSPAFEVIDADLRAGDPLALARVVGRIAALDAPTVVDPHCRAEQLEYLARHTGVTRVLVSDRLDDDELDAIVEAVGRLGDRPWKLRVRVSPAHAVHDRHVFDDDRVLQVGGVATATLPGGSTVLSEVTDLADEVRRYYRALWKRAERLAVHRPPST